MSMSQGRHNGDTRSVSQVSQLARKVQPSAPPQHLVHSNSVSTQPKPQVSRVTSNPPPPLPSALREAPPPVPQRVVSQSATGGSPKMVPLRQAPSIIANSNANSNSSSSQYKVFDRPPPPPPPSSMLSSSCIATAPPPAPMSIATTASANQRYSSFDRRFHFPDERTFPSCKRPTIGPAPGSRLSLCSRTGGGGAGRVEMNSY